MKKCIYLLLILSFFSCNKNELNSKVLNNTTTNKTIIKTDTVSLPVKDTIKAENTDKAQANNQKKNKNGDKSEFKELNIYDIGSYEKTNKKTIKFISLTDNYRYSEHSDSTVIDDRYLGNNKFEEHHELSKKYRKRFLKQMNIKETDKVFIYNYKLDSIITYSVSSLPLFAHITVYGAEPPIEQYVYLIGFNLGEKHIKDYTTYYSAFAYVGKNNPFVQGQLKPIVWKKIDPQTFPLVSYNKSKYPELKGFTTSTSQVKTYKFSHNDLDCYLKIYYDNNMNEIYYIVVKLNDNQIVFNDIFFDSEGYGLTQLSFVGKTNENHWTEQEQWQWAGQLFKSTPSVMFGFFSPAFGCSWIDVLDASEKRIQILCDNRH